MVDVSTVINLHREGKICESTVESVLSAVRKGQDAGISSEIICIIDNGNQETLRCIDRYNKFVTTYECHFGDLSQARNYGLEKSTAQYVTFIDGDDLWGNEWIVRCMETMTAQQSYKSILHSQMNLYFGSDAPSSFWVHPDTSLAEVDLLDVFVVNRWTALCFAHREVFENFPYISNQIDKGYGYEDWLWHIETMLSGYDHITCPKTCHFIRRKGAGSLLAQTNLSRSIPNIYATHDVDKLREALSKLTAREKCELRL